MSRYFYESRIGGIETKEFGELKNQDVNAFKEIVKEIEDYTKTHDYIGEFPTSQVTIERKLSGSVRVASARQGRGDRELQAGLRDIEDIREERKSAVWEIESLGRDLGVSNVTGLANYTVDKINKKAEDAGEQLRREAERRREEDEEAYNEGARDAVYKTKTIKQAVNSYNFFAGISGYWNGSTKITAAGQMNSNHVAAIVCLIYALLWAAFAGILQLSLNMLWQRDNPVSAWLGSQLSDEWYITSLFVAGTVILLLLCLLNSLLGMWQLPLFGAPIPKPAFAYSFLWSICFGIASVLRIESGSGSETLMKITLGVTAIWFLVHLWKGLGTYFNFFDAVKAMLVFLGYLVFSSYFIISALESSEEEIIKITSDGGVKQFLTGSNWIVGLFGLICIIGILGGLIYALINVLPDQESKDKLAQAVRENAENEHKMLRFVWLWIQNSDVHNKEEYFRAVKTEEERLKKLVRKGESYMKNAQ